MRLSIPRTRRLISTTGVLLITNLITLGALGYVYLDNPARQHRSQYPMLDIARDFIDQENFIVNIQPLREKVNSLVNEYGNDSVSLYIEFLNTGANISINPTLKLWAASLGKLPLGMAVMKKIERGLWSFNNELVLFESDRDTHSSDAPDPLFQYPVGTRFTIEKLMKYLLIYSDNTAANILNRNLSQDDLRLVVDDTGAEDLFTKDGKMSAKEQARLLRSLYTSSFLKRVGSERMLEWLTQTSFSEYLSAGLPKDIKFAHKYGKSIADKTIADSGIVYLPDRPILIVVMIQQSADTKTENNRAKTLMHDIAKETYKYFSNYTDV